MSKYSGCINEDNSHCAASFSNDRVMKACANRGQQSGGRRRRNSKSKRAGKRGGGRLYSLLANVDQKILGRAAGSGAYVAVPGDDVGLNACTNGTSRQYYNEELYGLSPLKAASLSGGGCGKKHRGGRKSRRRGGKRGGGVFNLGGTQSGCGCGYSLGDDYAGSSCGPQGFGGFGLLAGGRKKKRSRVSKNKRGGCGCGLKGGKRRTRRARRTRRRHGKRGGSATPTAFKDPNGYSLGGPGYTPKELLYGALSTPAPYKPYNNCN